MCASRLQTTSLEKATWGPQVISVLQAALAAVEPGAAVKNHIQRDGDFLWISGREYDLSRYQRVLVVGAGKAASPMTQATVDVLGPYLKGGQVVTKEGHSDGQSRIGPVAIAEASHPLPDERGVQAARRMLDMLASTTSDDLVICLISGGGSALLVSPTPGVTLGDMQGLTSSLLACGATINEINTLRKHLDVVKGGGLARAVSPASLVTLILSDVVGDPLDMIASGPTVPDTTTFVGAYQVLERYNLFKQVPPAIVTHIEKGYRGEIPDTPKAGDPLFEHVHNIVVGSNRQAAQAALECARGAGMQAQLLTTYLQGEARQVGRVLGAIARQIHETGEPLPRPCCLIAGGETTVTLAGKGGKGGRNQEMALAAVSDLAALQNVALVALATDGGDGPTDAAGAVVTGDTLSEAMAVGLQPADFLARNDAYHFFDRLGDLLKPGPTQTNVNDLAFIFAL